jgi:cytochrome c peroxidase
VIGLTESSNETTSANRSDPGNPNCRDGERSDAAVRGQALFEGKARCARCHKGDDYTSGRNYDVKLEPDGSPYLLWNPPSLRGLHDRGPYLHDGRARSLDDMLRTHRAPEKLGGEALTDDERRDLVAFLNAL